MRAAVAVLISLLLAGAAQAHVGPGPAAPGTAIACYDPATGEIIVSANGVTRWHIESATQSFTGQPPFWGLVGALPTDTDAKIGLASFGAPLNYIDDNVGPVAALGLPLSDLTLRYAVELGGTEVQGDVLLCVPEPSTLSMAALVAVVSRRRRTQWSSAR